MTSRRAFLLGAVTALAAPAIVRASSLMPLWVPPKPKLIVDLPNEHDWSGWLWDEQGRKVGDWTQDNGRIRYSYRNPDQINPANGVFSQSGSNMPVSKMFDVLESIGGVKPYAPRFA